MSELSASRNDFARRDGFVVWAANRVLRLTFRHYQSMVGGAILYGLGLAAVDAQPETTTTTEREPTMRTVVLMKGGHKLVVSGTVKELEETLREGRELSVPFVALESKGLYGHGRIAVDPRSVAALVPSQEDV